MGHRRCCCNCTIYTDYFRSNAAFARNWRVLSGSWVCLPEIDPWVGDGVTLVYWLVEITGNGKVVSRNTHPKLHDSGYLTLRLRMPMGADVETLQPVEEAALRIRVGCTHEGLGGYALTMYTTGYDDLDAQGIVMPPYHGFSFLNNLDEADPPEIYEWINPLYSDVLQFYLRHDVALCASGTKNYGNLTGTHVPEQPRRHPTGETGTGSAITEAGGGPSYATNTTHHNYEFIAIQWYDWQHRDGGMIDDQPQTHTEPEGNYWIALENLSGTGKAVCFGELIWKEVCNTKVGCPICPCTCEGTALSKDSLTLTYFSNGFPNCDTSTISLYKARYDHDIMDYETGEYISPNPYDATFMPCQWTGYNNPLDEPAPEDPDFRAECQLGWFDFYQCSQDCSHRMFALEWSNSLWEMNFDGNYEVPEWWSHGTGTYGSTWNGAGYTGTGVPFTMPWHIEPYTIGDLTPYWHSIGAGEPPGVMGWLFPGGGFGARCVEAEECDPLYVDFGWGMCYVDWAEDECAEPQWMFAFIVTE